MFKQYRSVLVTVAMVTTLSPCLPVLAVTEIQLARSVSGNNPQLETYRAYQGDTRSILQCTTLTLAKGCQSLLYNTATGECRGYTEWLTYPGTPASNWNYYRTQTAVDIAEYRIRIQSNDRHWEVTSFNTRFVKDAAVLSDECNFYLVPDNDNDWMRIYSSATGNYLHEDTAVDNKVNARWQSDDDHTWFRFLPQTDDSFMVEVKSGAGYLTWDNSDGHLKARQGPFDSSYRFYLEGI